MSLADAPIGVFDSGVGGLTVLAALRQRMPNESFVYLGDTARLPYGTKTAATVARYAEQASRCLLARGVKMVVIACNTASAVAGDSLGEHAGPRAVPVVGVVRPGAAAAVRVSRSGRIGVLATEGTIRGGAYERAIKALRPGAVVTGRACPLLVALAEEDWVDGVVPDAVAQHYLAALIGPAPDGQPAHDTLVLGCTHFPVLREVICRAAGPGVSVVDSAATTAAAAQRRLHESGLGAPADREPSAPRYLATDGAERFARVGSRFVGAPLDAADVEIVDL